MGAEAEEAVKKAEEEAAKQAEEEAAKQATQEALEKATEYVSAVQPRLDAFEAKQAAFTKRLEQTAAILVNRGVLDESKREAFLLSLIHI